MTVAGLSFEQVLMVVAHPDDEVLGCGGSISAWTSKGADAVACIMSGDAEARTRRPNTEDLRSDTLRAHRIIGAGRHFLGKFPNIELNTVPHVQLVQFIENAILETRPELILTHHPRDLNNDHHQVSLACQAAARIYQRRQLPHRLKALLLMEVLSSTDWAFEDGRNGFRPTAFVQIGERGLATKLEALGAYRDVMREYPHPRSSESVRALATLRGSQSGLVLAEAFEVASMDLSAY